MILRFAQPWFLLGLILVAGLIWWEIRNRNRDRAVAFSSLALLGDAKPSLRMRLRWLPKAARFLALAALVFAIARPQSGTAKAER